MKRGGAFLLLSSSLALASCGADHGVQVRAIADSSAKLRYSGGLLNQARAELAYGSVGLALETFRKLQREQGDSAEVYSGIAACYASMGRYDLTRTNYELALAYAPEDPALLRALATTLDRLGESEQAAQVRGEAARIASANAPRQPVQQAAVTPVGVPRMASMTVKLPPAGTAGPTARGTNAEIAAPQLKTAQVDLRQEGVRHLASAPLASAPVFVPLVPSEGSPGSTIAPPRPSTAFVSVAFSAPRELKVAALQPTAEILMPPLTAEAPLQIAAADLQKPAVVMGVARAPSIAQRDVAMAKLVAAARNVTLPARISSAATAVVAPDVPAGPRLERTSLGEVSLVTLPQQTSRARLGPGRLQAQTIARLVLAVEDRPTMVRLPQQPLVATRLRWTPLKYGYSTQSIALLNAARSEGLAARTRTALLDRGWHKIRVGNAAESRRHSVVLYGRGRGYIAMRLAAHFRCKAVQSTSVRNIVVLLGRDAALRGSLTARA